jgi:hypothetical protein
VLAGVLAVLLAWPSVAFAGPPAKGPEGPEPPPAEADAGAEAPPAEAEAPAEDPIGAAVERGDLSEAAEQATAARRQDPSPANWRREAEILEQKGDLEGAATAYQGELDALPKDDPGRDRAQSDLHRVREQARGRVETEPASTHREELDATWGPKTKKAPSKKRPKAAAPTAAEDRIVRKWYFWVTVAAIVASAAAVTGIAIKAARDERRDALDLVRKPSITGPAILRF